MTFNQVLAQVQYNVWGNTTPPPNMTANITNVIIPKAHRRIQLDYNYGFMQTWTEITTELGESGRYIQAYELPDAFKEIIAVNWQLVNSEDTDIGKSRELIALITGDAQKTFWKSDNILTVEYPTHFEIYNQSIVFYPEPNAVRTAIISYFQITECPAGDNEDILLRDGDDAVIAKATALVYKSLHDIENFQLWEGLFQDEEYRLRSLDFSKRQSQFKEIFPNDFDNLYN